MASGLMQRKKLDGVEPLVTDEPETNNKDLASSEKQMSAHRSKIGKFWYIGRLVFPSIVFLASQAATKCNYLRQHHLRRLKNVLGFIKESSCSLRFVPSASPNFKQEAMSDDSMNTKNGNTKVRKGILIFRRFSNISYGIGMMSRLARRAFRSTNTAELFAAASAVDGLTYVKHFLKENIGMQKSKLIFDSRSDFHLCATTKEPEKIKNRFLLASIHEKFHISSMDTI